MTSEIVWASFATLLTGTVAGAGKMLFGHNTRLAVLEEQHKELKADLAEIKRDVKEVLKHANGNSKS